MRISSNYSNVNNIEFSKIPSSSSTFENFKISSNDLDNENDVE